MERARALADIEKAKSDIARGDVTQGYALYNSAVARLDKAKADATQAGSMLTGQQMTAETSQYATNSQAVNERNALAQRGTAEENRNLVSMYGTDAGTAAQLQAAGISAAAHRYVADSRNGDERMDRIMEIIRKATNDGITDRDKLTMTDAQYRQRFQANARIMLPMYIDREKFLKGGAPVDSGVPEYDPRKVRPN
jgi:hypothetical protein